MSLLVNFVENQRCATGVSVDRHADVVSNRDAVAIIIISWEQQGEYMLPLR